MGILYSLTAYFSSASGLHLTEARIRTSSQRLIIRIRNLQYKLQQEVFKAEEELVAQMRQPTAIRSRQGELVRIDRIIKDCEKRLVYDEVIY
jgi:flagellar basal body rod protein FlgC